MKRTSSRSLDWLSLVAICTAGGVTDAELGEKESMGAKFKDKERCRAPESERVRVRSAEVRVGREDEAECIVAA